MKRKTAILVAALFLSIADCIHAQTKPRVVHVFVALADNQHQGIVPVPATLGNGDDPARNLYWGAAFGVRTLFRKSSDWGEAEHAEVAGGVVLVRSVFVHRSGDVLLVADAYRGREIKQALADFFHAAGGMRLKTEMPFPPPTVAGAFLSAVASPADLVVYLGHDGLMDFPLKVDFAGRSATARPAIVLACASRSFFRDLLKQSGATPLLWTNGLMAPEAYTLKAALDGWIANESNEQIRQRAAAAYAQYQKCSNAAALRLFSSNW